VSFNLRLLEQSKAELADAVEWYETREVGLGRDLLDEVMASFESIERDPTRFVLDESYGGRIVRTCMLRRFPYRMIFEVRKDEIVDLAVAHHRRQPGFWHKRR